MPNPSGGWTQSHGSGDGRREVVGPDLVVQHQPGHTRLRNLMAGEDAPLQPNFGTLGEPFKKPWLYRPVEHPYFTQQAVQMSTFEFLKTELNETFDSNHFEIVLQKNKTR